MAVPIQQLGFHFEDTVLSKTVAPKTRLISVFGGTSFADLSK
jgi:hypothetical protein